MSPHVVMAQNGKSTPPSSDADSTSLHMIRANPFGPTVDPQLLSNNVYSSAQTIISQAIYALASQIFSYETAGASNLVDAHLQLWAGHFKRPNAVGVVPPFYRLEPRSGAASAILGYADGSQRTAPFSAVLGASTLAYMQPTLQNVSVPVALHVSAVSFDTGAGALVSDYSAPLAAARVLSAPVVSPVSKNPLDLQYSVVLTNYLAELTGKPAVHVFDGPEFARTFERFEGVMSVADVGRLYNQLLAAEKPTPNSVDEALDVAFETFNAVAGSNIQQFEYEGHAAPETVFVVFGAHEASQVAGVVAKAAQSAAVGVLKVRVPFPFNQAKFAASIPASTRQVVVFSPEAGSTLKADATAALFFAGRFPATTVAEFVYSPSFVWTPITVLKVLTEYAPSIDHGAVLVTPKAALGEITANTSPQGSFLVWARDNSDVVTAAGKLALSLSLDDSKRVSIRNKFDISVGGGIFQSQIVSADRISPVSSAVDAADVVLVEDVSILSHFDVLATAKPGAKILVANHKKIASVLEFVDKLPADFRKTVTRNHLSLTVVDFSTVEALDTVSDLTKGFSADFLAQVAFWRASLPELGGFVVNKLLQANGNDFELLAVVLDKFVATVDEQELLKHVIVLPEWADLEEEIAEAQEETEDENEELDENSELPFFPTESSFFPNPRVEPASAEEVHHVGVSDLAVKLAFPEAFGVSSQLRPDLPVQNFVVKVQENKRLTPAEYSRNIFHIEFDITGTGLKYEIGEALGIHGRNNANLVEEFLQFYGVDGDSLVEVPNKEDPSVLEIRSARQALLDNVDFQGKPPKRFYESLAPFASDEKEKAALENLASGAGAAELKKRQDEDFCTYVDILDEFKSARPSFADLVKIIAPLKRREYSIASSQKMHPNAVHLLIVVVDWVDPKGRTRFGHCSKYLSDLAIGDELVVSVKPSVMKLPKLPEQPIVMSGLGTGLAPFKAFIEEKIWQQSQGQTIGEIYLYMGSRHKKEEYLYGELWEAYKLAGILTHIGAAFSRDQPEKIYIQDKIRSSIEDLTDAIVTKNGSFYLCGPTWPVPDITACLEDIVKNGARREGKEIKDAAKVVEDMKEDGRYILEVY